MPFSEMLNILLGGGLVTLVLALATMKATVRKANADAEKAKADADAAKADAEKARADAEAVRITNAESATRILVENIVKPLKEELHATREKLSTTEGVMASIQKEMASTKRAMSRLSRAVESANNCPHADDCVVLRKLQDHPKRRKGGDCNGRSECSPGQPVIKNIDIDPGDDTDERGFTPYLGRQPPEAP